MLLSAVIGIGEAHSRNAPEYPDKALIERAEAGNVSAQQYLGNFYKDKLNPTQDDSEQMLYWYEMAAKTSQFEPQGSTDAHAELGRFYCGEVCFPDTSEAPTENRRQVMQLRIDEVLRHHVKPNYVTAYLHFMLSAKPLKLDYSYFLSRLESHMSRDDVRRAKHLAGEWRKNMSGE